MPLITRPVYLIFLLCLTVSSSAHAGILRLDVWDGGGNVTNFTLSGTALYNSSIAIVSTNSSFLRGPNPTSAQWQDFSDIAFDAWDDSFDTSLVDSTSGTGSFEFRVDGVPIPHTFTPGFGFSDQTHAFYLHDDAAGYYPYPNLSANQDYLLSWSGSGQVDFGDTFSNIWTNGTYTVAASAATGGVQYDLVVSDSGPSMGGAVPEPSSIALLGLSSIGGLVFIRRRRRLQQNQLNHR